MDDDKGDGWKFIKKLGAWNCLIPKFGALEEIPAQHRAVWSWAWGEVLRPILEAKEGSEDLDLALLWLLFLPQALCRKPEGRGGLRGRGFINQRFGSLAEGNWGKLIDLWEKDVEKKEARGERRRGEYHEEEPNLDRKRKEVLKLLGKGQIPGQLTPRPRQQP